MPNPWKRILLGLLLGLALYCLIGFLLVPGLLLDFTRQQLQQRAMVPTHLGQVTFNPFTLELTAEDFRLGAADAPEVSAQRLSADIAWSSLWRGALHIEQLELSTPQVRLTQDKHGVVNAAHWFKPPVSNDDNSDADTPFPVVIAQLQLHDGHITFDDQRLSEPLSFSIEALSLSMQELSTVPEQRAQVRLSAQGPVGSSLEWEGQLGLVPLHADGTLTLSDIQLPQFAPYLRQSIPLVLREGQLDVASHFRLVAGQPLQLQTQEGTARLSNLELDLANGAPLLRLPLLKLDQLSADLTSRDLHIGQLHSQGLETWIARDESGQLNWQALLADIQPTTNGNERATSKAPWRIRLGNGEVSGYHAHLADRLPAEPVELEVGPLDAQIRDFDSQGSSPFFARLETAVGRHGQLVAEGEATLAPAMARLAIQSRDLDLRLAQPYLAPYLRLEVRSGLLGSDLQLNLRSTQPLDFDITGQLQVSQLHTRDKSRNRDFVRWRQLQVHGLTYQHGKRLEIASVDLAEPYARFIIYPNLSTNLGDLLVNKTAKRESGASPDDAPLAIRIAQVKVKDGSAHFADLSLRPNFVTDIRNLDGEVSAIDNRAKQPATVSLSGKVDRYAPVSVKGYFAPFDPLQQLNIAARFQQLELTTLTPYAAKFAGYRIRKGRMNLALHYRIEDHRLQADHDIVIDELQLGDRVESEVAVDLPVRLAVALLKDSNGTITLDIPIEGDLDNPKFEVMPLVWKTLRNLLTKAAKSPFTLIGALVGAPDSDLSQIKFAPGTAVLDESARHDLAQLATALTQRPELRLEVEGAASPALDGPAVARQRLELGMQRLWYQELQRQGERVPADASQLEVPEAERARLIGRLYRRWIDPDGSRAADMPPAGETEAMRDALLERWASSEPLLRRLGQVRAAVIKDFLVDQQGLNDQRVFLLDARVTDQGQADQVQVQLHLGST